jgi:hypothetical protein
MTLLIVTEYFDHYYVPFVIFTIRFFRHSWLITWFVTRVPGRLPIVEQKLHNFPDQTNSLLLVLMGFVLSNYMSSRFYFVLWFPHKAISGSTWLLFVCRGLMFYLCYLYLFTHTGAQREFHIRSCFCRLTVTRFVSHVEQELKTLPEYLT